jgi:hypothetical protein
LTPHFYDPVVSTSARYSFTGAIKAPRQILPGGYISFFNPDEQVVQQILWVDPSKAPILKTLGVPNGAMSLRSWVDSQMQQAGVRTTMDISTSPANNVLLSRCKEHRAKLNRIAEGRAAMYEEARGVSPGLK